MAPTLRDIVVPTLHNLAKREPIPKPSDPDALILEAWAQGYMVGSLIIMAAITIANMRRGVLLHKLILLELILGTFHGTFMFCQPPTYGWYLSVTAIPLNISWSLHNVIAWMKTKPFLSKKWSWFYIGTVALAQPYWVVEIYANFVYFNYGNTIFLRTRPYEALFRDPWWTFTTMNLFWNIATRYNIPFHNLIAISPRFGVLLGAMLLSICFIIVDICAVTGAFNELLPDGLNPFWKMAFVFKCLTDSIVLDDFKTALDAVMKWKLRREGMDAEIHTRGGGRSGSCANGAGFEGFEDPLSEDRIDRIRAQHRNERETSGVPLDHGPVSNGANQYMTKGKVISAMDKHIENYEDIDLPDLESSTSAEPTEFKFHGY